MREMKKSTSLWPENLIRAVDDESSIFAHYILTIFNLRYAKKLLGYELLLKKQKCEINIIGH